MRDSSYLKERHSPFLCNWKLGVVTSDEADNRESQSISRATDVKTACTKKAESRSEESKKRKLLCCLSSIGGPPRPLYNGNGQGRRGTAQSHLAGTHAEKSVELPPSHAEDRGGKVIRSQATRAVSSSTMPERRVSLPVRCRLMSFVRRSRRKSTHVPPLFPFPLSHKEEQDSRGVRES